MKMQLLVIGAAILLATYFLLPMLHLTGSTANYAMYAGYGLGAILLLAGLFGKKRFY